MLKIKRSEITKRDIVEELRRVKDVLGIEKLEDVKEEEFSVINIEVKDQEITLDERTAAYLLRQDEIAAKIKETLSKIPKLPSYYRISEDQDLTFKIFDGKVELDYNFNEYSSLGSIDRIDNEEELKEYFNEFKTKIIEQDYAKDDLPLKEIDELFEEKLKEILKEFKRSKLASDKERAKEAFKVMNEELGIENPKDYFTNQVIYIKNYQERLKHATYYNFEYILNWLDFIARASIVESEAQLTNKELALLDAHITQLLRLANLNTLRRYDFNAVYEAYTYTEYEHLSLAEYLEVLETMIERIHTAAKNLQNSHAGYISLLLSEDLVYNEYGEITSLSGREIGEDEKAQAEEILYYIGVKGGEDVE